MIRHNLKEAKIKGPSNLNLYEKSTNEIHILINIKFFAATKSQGNAYISN